MRGGTLLGSLSLAGIVPQLIARVPGGPRRLSGDSGRSLPGTGSAAVSLRIEPSARPSRDPPSQTARVRRIRPYDRCHHLPIKGRCLTRGTAKPPARDERRRRRDRFIGTASPVSPRMEKKVLGAFLYVLIFPALILVLSGDLALGRGMDLQPLVHRPLLHDDPVPVPEGPGPARGAVQTARRGEPGGLGPVRRLRPSRRVHPLGRHHAARREAVRLVPRLPPLARRPSG